MVLSMDAMLSLSKVVADYDYYVEKAEAKHKKPVSMFRFLFGRK